MNARELVEFIRDLDTGSEASSSTEIEYIELTRWNRDGEGGNRDDKATVLIRALAREKLGTFPLDEIGGAVLAQIDEATA